MLVTSVEQHQRNADDGEQEETHAHGEPASTEAWRGSAGRTHP
jgi:hypothetical protein